MPTPPPPMASESVPLDPTNTSTSSHTSTQQQRQEPQQYPTPTQGIINQGCTCYLNSLLQLLFHLGYFRSAVYRMTCRAEEDQPIPQALQSLFFQMQERLTAPTTRGLTDAFGWDEREVFTQHDIQELAALLRDCLENRMRGTPSEGAINRMFEGVGEQVVQTLDGSYTSRSKDTFFDIHLPIQGFPNITESLRSLTVKDQLVGDNKYKVEQEGQPAVYKDAEKGYRFVKFPPVIFFHMKRFEMDLMSPTLEMKKINSSFEFQEEIDLREFEDADATAIPSKQQQSASASADDFDRDSQAVYDLTGVIVHRGTARSGHYYCYIRHFDTEQGRFTHWLEYDDDNVRVVDSYAAIEGNFGGMRTSTVHGRPHTFMSTNNAYILSYVRRADRGVVLAPSPTDIIPESVKQELRRVMEADEKRSMIEKVRRSQVRVVLATDEAINRCVQENIVDLLPREERLQQNFCKYVDVKKTDTFASMYISIAEALGSSKYPHDRIRIWKWQSHGHEKSNFRPTAPQKTFDECSADVIIGPALLTQATLERDVSSTVMLYVERFQPNYDSQRWISLLTSHRAVRVFVKACAPRDRTMMFLAPVDLVKDQTLTQYLGQFAALLGVELAALENNRIAIAIEGNRSVASRMLDLRQQIAYLGLATGDIIVLQYLPMSPVYRCLTAVEIIHEARETLKIQIREKANPSNILGELKALCSWDYESVCDGIAKMLQQRNSGRAFCADHIQLFRNTDYINPSPMEQAIRPSSNPTALDMCSGGHTSYLFYEVLEVPRTGIETINVRLFDRDGRAVVKDVVISTTVPVLLSKLVAEVIDAPAVTPAKKPSPPVASPSATATAETAEGPTAPDTNAEAQKNHTSVAVAGAPPSDHYIVQFVFEEFHRPSRLPIDVPMDSSNTQSPPSLSRVLCPGEWIYVYPGAPPRIGGGRPKNWVERSSDSDEEGSPTMPVSSSTRNVDSPSQHPCIRVPVTQGEYMGAYCYSSNFGFPSYVDIDPSHTTIQEVFDAVTAHYGIDGNSDEIMEHPLMLCVDKSVAEADHLQTERDVETFFYQSKHYRFTNVNEKIFPFLQHNKEGYYVYLNRKKPKEKPGSRYVATNDPKLVIEKRKQPA